MAQVTARGLDDEVVARLKDRARRHGRSLQAEMRRILEAAAAEPEVDFEAGLARVRALLGSKTFDDSAALIREDREG